MPAYWVAPSKINDPVEYTKYADRDPNIIVGAQPVLLQEGEPSPFSLSQSRGARQFRYLCVRARQWALDISSKAADVFGICQGSAHA
jgi:hypothetical protein